MRVIVVVIATLATVGLAVLGMFTAPTLSSPTDHVVRVKSAPEAQGSRGATRFSNPVAPAASVSATPSSASAAVAPERMSQNDASSALAAVTATDNADVRKSINIATCDRPDAIGLSRIVDIDTRAGPEFGFQHLKGYDFLRDKEVVLTFDDGPRPQHTSCAQSPPGRCLKATFFEIGEDASWHPEITKQVIDAGMTVGTHTTL